MPTMTTTKPSTRRLSERRTVRSPANRLAVAPASAGPGDRPPVLTQHRPRPLPRLRAPRVPRGVAAGARTRSRGEVRRWAPVRASRTGVVSGASHRRQAHRRGSHRCHPSTPRVRRATWRCSPRARGRGVRAARDRARSRSIGRRSPSAAPAPRSTVGTRRRPRVFGHTERQQHERDGPPGAVLPRRAVHDHRRAVRFDQRAHELGVLRAMRFVDHERVRPAEHHVAGGSGRERLLDPFDVARAEQLPDVGAGAHVAHREVHDPSRRVEAGSRPRSRARCLVAGRRSRRCRVARARRRRRRWRWRGDRTDRGARCGRGDRRSSRDRPRRGSWRSVRRSSSVMVRSPCSPASRRATRPPSRAARTRYAAAAS